MDLFAKAKAGDKHSIELLVEQYYRLAYKTVYVWIRKGKISKEEGISEANLALLECIRGRYDSSKGDFIPYLVKAVNNQVRLYLRRKKKDGRIEYVNRYVVLEDEVVELFAVIADPHCSIEDEVERKVLVDMLMRLLRGSAVITKKEKDSLFLWMNGLTCSEIGQVLGISRAYASRLYNNAIVKIKKALKEQRGVL